jgi:DNA-binding NtrC family response regulator
MGQAQQRHRAVLIVEDDADIRSLTAALLEDEQVDTIECESAEAALATMLIGGREVAMIFADVRLRGVMDGIDLAREVRMRWPLLPVILTSGHPREHFGELPPGVGYMPKPWKPLNLLVAAEQALGEFISRQGRQSIVQGAKEVGRTTSQGIAEASRRGSEAA